MTGDGIVINQRQACAIRPPGFTGPSKVLSNPAFADHPDHGELAPSMLIRGRAR